MKRGYVIRSGNVYHVNFKPKTGPKTISASEIATVYNRRRPMPDPDRDTDLTLRFEDLEKMALREFERLAEIYNNKDDST